MLCLSGPDPQAPITYFGKFTSELPLGHWQAVLASAPQERSRVALLG